MVSIVLLIGNPLTEVGRAGIVGIGGVLPRILSIIVLRVTRIGMAEESVSSIVWSGGG